MLKKILILFFVISIAIVFFWSFYLYRIETSPYDSFDYYPFNDFLHYDSRQYLGFKSFQETLGNDIPKSSCFVEAFDELFQGKDCFYKGRVSSVDVQSKDENVRILFFDGGDSVVAIRKRLNYTYRVEQILDQGKINKLTYMEYHNRDSTPILVIGSEYQYDDDNQLSRISRWDSLLANPNASFLEYEAITYKQDTSANIFSKTMETYSGPAYYLNSDFYQIPWMLAPVSEAYDLSEKRQLQWIWNSDSKGNLMTKTSNVYTDRDEFIHVFPVSQKYRFETVKKGVIKGTLTDLSENEIGSFETFRNENHKVLEYSSLRNRFLKKEAFYKNKLTELVQEENQKGVVGRKMWKREIFDSTSFQLKTRVIESAHTFLELFDVDKKVQKENFFYKDSLLVAKEKIINNQLIEKVIISYDTFNNPSLISIENYDDSVSVKTDVLNFVYKYFPVAPSAVRNEKR